MKLNKSKNTKLNLMMIGLYAGLMLIWLAFGRPITEFVAPKLPARNLYCCEFGHNRNYGAIELYDYEYGLGVSYTKGVESLDENKTKTIKELESIGYHKSVQTGGMYIFLTFMFMPILLIYNFALILKKKIKSTKANNIIKNILIIIALIWTLFVFGVGGHSMWYGIW
jgi:hypothetical protein